MVPVMRYMVKFWIPVHVSDELSQNGNIGQIISQLIEEYNPESTFFFPEDNVRSGIMILNMGDPSQLDRLGKSFKSDLRAEISVTPVLSD